MAEMNQVKIGDVCTLEKGTTGLAKAYPGEYPLVTTGAERKTSREYQFDAKAVCIPLVSSTGHGKKTLNYVHYQEGKFALGTILVAVIPNSDSIINARYLHIYLQKNKDRVLVPLMKGAANVSLSVKDIANIEIPLPSIKEQDEIISKVDSISDEHLEFLNETDIQFDLLEQFRQSILQGAIEGKLTEKWRYEHPALISGDNHAFKLLENLKMEKERLIKEGKLKKEKPLPPIIDAEMPLALPNGWIWCHINDIGENVNNAIVDGPFGSHLLTSDYDKYGEYPVLTITCIDQGFDLSSLRRINKSKYEQIKRSTTKGGDVLVAKIGSSYGKVGEYPEGYPDAIIPANLLKITLNSRINKPFIKYLLSSLFFKKELDGITQFHAQPAFNMKNFKRIPIPIPPIAEQQAIVDRIENLMNMIDKLETQISIRKQQLEMLMQTFLREAFANSDYL